MSLCLPCAVAYNKWLDSPPPPQPIQLVTVGVNSARAVEENRRLRGEAHRRLVRTQLRLIIDICHRDHQEGRP